MKIGGESGEERLVTSGVSPGVTSEPEPEKQQTVETFKLPTISQQHNFIAPTLYTVSTLAPEVDTGKTLNNVGIYR